MKTIEFSGNRDWFLLAALVAVLAGVFVSDLLLPLGTAVWVIYLVPTVLAYAANRPATPLAVAVAVTLLLVVGFVVDHPGIDPDVARLNRVMGGLTVWVLAATGYLFIGTRIAVRRQEWLQTTQVLLAQELAGELELEVLGERVIRFLAERLGAQAGLIFVQRGEGFERIGSFGVPADAKVVDRIGRGDGLAGEVIAGNHSLTVDDVPEDYLVYGSGLGRARPRKLILAPVRADDLVNGVLELGYSRDIDEMHRELLERVSGDIGIAIRSAKYRTRLEELLEETRRQAEELRAHTEELAASNEELAEQSRALQDSQARLELQQSELEQSNAQLEEQTQLLEAQRDDLSRSKVQLQSQTRELEAASRYKSEFVANMSHELRTPLNALLIMARLLADNRSGNLTAEQVSFAETIEGSGNDLLNLINDILDLSKIEAGRLDLDVRDVGLGGLAAKLESAFRPLADKRGIGLSSVLAADLPKAIATDVLRVEQILRNFLSNAIKFTERGAVSLELTQRSDGRIAFAVRDSGIGIAGDQQQTIFEAFRQADGSISRKYGGTGLGLSISRELAGLLGGEIEVESEPGRGSTFTLLLPPAFKGEAPPAERRELVREHRRAPHLTDKPTPATAAPRPASFLTDDRDTLSAGGRTILVVEDDPAFARVLFDLAHELGFKCIVAASAEDGVLAARQYLPDAVILDVGLPDHNGLSVLDRLKRHAPTRHIPVHVVSVSDYSETALSFGAVGYMLKPVRRERLVEALEGLEHRLAQRIRRVLILEDDPAQLRGLEKLLASKEVETVGVTTAAQGIDKLRSETFDCLVLDMSLPDATGFEVLEQLADDERVSFPPVIVYTARELSADEELRLRRYSKSIIIKGAKSPERLIDEVSLFLHQVVSELPPEQPRLLAASLNRDATLDGRRILVVEDDVRNVFAVTSIFEPHGATVQIARNGREALDALEAVTSGLAPKIDLVLMDVMMPEMDGLTATRRLRERPELSNLPIIALTAKAMPDDQEECLAAGADDYLAKPLDVDKLLSLARVWMPKK